MKILILGGSGFIGQRIVSKWSERRDMKLWVATRTTINKPEVEGAPPFLSIAAGEEYADLFDALAGETLDAIINCAAYGVQPTERDPILIHAVNLKLPLRLVEVARQTGAALIQLGSCSEYAPQKDQRPIVETALPEQRNLYGTSKYCAGLLMILKAAHFSVPAVVLRLFNVYGPGEAPYRLLPSIASKLCRNEIAPLSLGLQVRDFIYLDDVLEALELSISGLMQQTLEPGIYNIATGQGCRVKDFACKTARLLDKSPSLLGFGQLPLRPDEPPWMVGSSQAFHSYTGWAAKTDLDKGIATTLDALGFRRNG